MPQTFVNMLYPRKEAEFTSNHSVDESVQRLRKLTKPRIFQTLFKASVVGRVTRQRVRLRRVTPLFGNSFKPVFVGQFRDSGGKVTLTGRFTTALSTRILVTIWLGIAVLSTFEGIVQGIGNAATAVDGYETGTPPHSTEFFEILLPTLIIPPLSGAIMIVLLCCLLKFASWTARRDITVISDTIEQALTN